MKILLISVVAVLAFGNVLSQDIVEAHEEEKSDDMVMMSGGGSGSGSGDGEECQYTHCYNDGVCRRLGEKDGEYAGIEYCECGMGFTGETCDVLTGECEISTCEHGICFSGNDSIITCSCEQGYGGIRCEIADETRTCPMPDVTDGDGLFFPACTLKTTMGLFQWCIEHQLPFLDPLDRDEVHCRAKLTTTIRCLNSVVNKCSNLQCSSVWELPGFADFFRDHWAPAMYDPFSQLRMELYNKMCKLDSSPANFGNIIPPNPVCGSDLFSTMFDAIAGNAQMVFEAKTLMDTCKQLEGMKLTIHNHVLANCNFTKFDQLSGIDFTTATGLQHALGTVEKHFLEWVIPACRSTTGECKYTNCKNNGTCMRSPDGIEYCNCMPGYIGIECSFMTGSCGQDLVCQNGGSCFNSNGAISCLCPPGFSGKMCEMRNDSRQCPVPGDNDIIFFPSCTLRTTMHLAAMCIQEQLPFVESGDTGHCRGKLTKAVRCITNIISNCSGMMCDSIWEVPGFLEFFSSTLTPALYDPTSMFRTMLYQRICEHDTSVPDLTGLEGLTHICGAEFLPGLMKIVEEVSEDLFNAMDIFTVCGKIEALKVTLGAHVTDSCDLSKLTDFLSPEIAAGFTKALEVAYDYFTDLIMPQCRDIVPPVVDDVCKPITADSSQCELADTWACEFTHYMKSMMTWRSTFMEWWAGCDGFTTRDWLVWATRMGLRGAHPMHHVESYGRNGFIAMVQANIQCPGYMHLDCGAGEMRQYQDDLGCMWPYCSNGKTANARQMLTMWMAARKTHEALTKIYSYVVSECSSSSGFSDCEVGSGSGSGMPPFPGSTSMPFTSTFDAFTTGMPPSTTFTTSTTRVVPTVATSQMPTMSQNPTASPNPTMSQNPTANTNPPTNP